MKGKTLIGPIASCTIINKELFSQQTGRDAVGGFYILAHATSKQWAHAEINYCHSVLFAGVYVERKKLVVSLHEKRLIFLKIYHLLSEKQAVSFQLVHQCRALAQYFTRYQ